MVNLSLKVVIMVAIKIVLIEKRVLRERNIEIVVTAYLEAKGEVYPIYNQKAWNKQLRYFVTCLHTQHIA